MKKWIGRILLSVLLLIVIAVFSYLGYIAPGVTGYAAKNLASGVFLSGRTQESLEKEDLSFFPIRYTKNKVDLENRTVTSKFFLWKAEAVYNEGFGCTLIRDFPKESVKEMKFPDISVPGNDQDTVDWPAGNIVSDSIPQGINLPELEKIMNSAFSDTFPRKGAFGIMVVYRGQIVAEKYREDFTPETRMLSWSMAKSFINTMTGILVKEGKIDLKNNVPREEWANDERKNITLNHLMQMNSGLEWNEEYSKVKLSDVTTMLTKKGDMAAYAASRKLVAPPGTTWTYSGGTTNIVSRYIRSIINNDDAYHAMPYTALFHKIGMHSAIWEPDASGTLVGSSYIYATLRDFARFGLLYLHGGKWLGEQILPEGWVDYTTTVAEGSGGQYGAMFWLNRSGEYPGVPEDMYRCQGHDGQRVWIIPSKNLVVVKTGYSPKGTFNDQEFLKEIVSCFSEIPN